MSIRPGWFYHPAEDSRVKSVTELVDIYFTSVGRNSKLLLNVPPTPDGLLHDTDVQRLSSMRGELDRIFSENHAAGREFVRRTRNVYELDINRTVNVAIADLREDITRGQLIASYSLEGRAADAWVPLSRGTTVGYRKLDRFEPTPINRIRLTIEDAIATPTAERLTVGLYS